MLYSFSLTSIALTDTLRVTGPVTKLFAFYGIQDRLCDLVVRVPGYRSRGPVSILGATRFSEK
jgi:hypothetical protein